MNNRSNNSKTEPSQIIIKPKLKWLTVGYFLFSIPGFIISLVWLLISLVVLVGLVDGNVSQSKNSSKDFQFETITDSKSNKSVLIYELSGAIDTGGVAQNLPADGIFTELVKEDFNKIKENKDIEAVVFKLNTPGGTIFASEVLGDLINDLMVAKGQQTPVFYYDQLVASGGLWASNKTKNAYIVGSEYGQTGSIGVVLSLPNFTGLADKVGYSEVVIKSAPSKDIGNPLRDITAEEKTYLDNQVKESYEKFINVVANGRGVEPDKVREFANGYVFNNKQAKDYGLINEIGTLDTAVAKVVSSKDIKEYDLIRSKKLTNPIENLFLNNSLVRNFIVTQETINKPFVLQSGIIYAIDANRI